MRTSISLFILACLLSMGAHAQSQSFKKTQQKQEAAIKAAKKKKRVTDLEYQKLMKEQSVIKAAMERAEMDGVWTPKEKNEVHGKLQRAAKRLRRYQHNSEVY